MEEVDKILILSLNQLGCDLNEEVKRVADFGVSEVILGVTKCLKAINRDNEVPTSLPQNMAQRFRVASTIAQAIKDAGYPGDVGYQSLLYPSEADLRKILMFLIEKLPKDTTSASDEPLNKASLIHQEVKRKLSEALVQAWIPPNCRRMTRGYAIRASVTKYGTHHTNHFISKPYTSLDCSTKVSPAKRRYFETYARRVTKMLGNKYYVATLLNNHATQLEYDRIVPTSKHEKENSEALTLDPLFTGRVEDVVQVDDPAKSHSLLSAFGTYKELINTNEHGNEVKDTQSTDLQEVGMTTEEKIIVKREEHLSQCQNEVTELTKSIEECLKIVEDTESALNKLKEDMELEDRLVEEKATELKMKQRTASLIPDSDSNVQKLQTAVKNSEEKMTRLQQQWETHKQPLSEHLTKLSNDITGKKGSKEQLRAKMSDLRDKMRIMVQDASRKEAVLSQLKSQCENMNRDINRSIYTKRIVDISAKVRKQKEEIDRVLADTRMIQKEINTISGKLERTFTVVESTAFKEAGSNERARQVYRAVAAVHEGCGDLVEIIRETGTVQREISDLKEQVDLEKSKKVEENLEQLKTDLSQVKKENAALKQQLL